jgi:hypothetical protein
MVEWEFGAALLGLAAAVAVYRSLAVMFEASRQRVAADRFEMEISQRETAQHYLQSRVSLRHLQYPHHYKPPLQIFLRVVLCGSTADDV